MKGLTPIEKRMIEACCSTYEPGEGRDENLREVCEKLVREGRLRIVQVEGGAIYQATDMGRSALVNAIVKAE